MYLLNVIFNSLKKESLRRYNSNKKKIMTLSEFFFFFERAFLMEAPRRGMMRGRKSRFEPQNDNETPKTFVPTPPRAQKDRWIPKTKLGRLVAGGQITTIEQIFESHMQIREPEIVTRIFGDTLKVEVLKIKPVQKQTPSGERTRFKAVVAVGDFNGHIGLGIKTAAEVANAINGATIFAQLAIFPVKRGYWGPKTGNPHTVSQPVTGKFGPIVLRLIPAPRGSGIVASAISKKILALAGIEDVFTSCIGNTKSTSCFLVATYKALQITYRWPQKDLDN